MTQATILVVEDDFDHAALIQAVFATGLANVPVHVAFSGEEARSYLIGEWPYDQRYKHPLPSLIVLDLWLPDTTGLEIVEWLRDDEVLAAIPVIMFTSSANPKHLRKADALGVRRYLIKAADFGELVVAVKKVLGPWIESESDAVS